MAWLGAAALFGVVTFAIRPGELTSMNPPPPRLATQREKYASAYDSLAQTGVPEYAVYIREGVFSDALCCVVLTPRAFLPD